MRVYAVKHTRHLVAQREVDTLTPQEVRRHQALADAGIKEEPATWNRHKCIVR